MNLNPQKILSPSAERVFTIEAPMDKNKKLTIRYVPDREMVKCEHFQEWLSAKHKKDDTTIEELTTEIGCNFYDAILPRYMDLKIHYTRTDGLINHAYFVHHQPEYKLPKVLMAIFER